MGLESGWGEEVGAGEELMEILCRTRPEMIRSEIMVCKMFDRTGSFSTSTGATKE